MFHIVLYEPEIAPNTGNIIRLCANTGTHLHLIHPVGFQLDDKKLRRAGLDYREFVNIQEFHSLDEFRLAIAPRRLFGISTKGQSCYSNIHYQAGDAFLLGPETRGLPQTVLDALPEENILRIPMREHSRSLNLANAAAVMVYEAWRQHDFKES
ncbi:MAG: tRNA (uridine(34)/cytosine(34)/5-carboxymethylaminomethyluridine(34)-2'-O)-methyltransferase TrmL [Gammaproteobacteria bacterium]|nr:tRNA (uridine(34)/cytosine(34)/5-carboxymethylaminomethyluridine(34)-2'-O)-methyltransferase TrmL [Gammaproteobacteria bacterium]